MLAYREMISVLARDKNSASFTPDVRTSYVRSSLTGPLKNESLKNESLKNDASPLRSGGASPLRPGRASPLPEPLYTLLSPSRTAVPTYDFGSYEDISVSQSIPKQPPPRTSSLISDDLVPSRLAGPTVSTSVVLRDNELALNAARNLLGSSLIDEFLLPVKRPSRRADTGAELILT